jgi:penicillin-binding protein 1A
MILGFFVLVYYAYDLPDIDKLNEDKLKSSIVIQDYKGQFLASYGDIYTEYVKYDDIPQNLIDAVIATEDRRFFKHWGIDLRGLARAVFVNIAKGRMAQGGSTVTQQLAKNVFLKPDRNLKRKIQEAMLAIWLEKHYSKEQIIEMYLNRVYLGGGVYGIDAASRKYFNKTAKRMNLYESAMIAGMMKAPTSYSPQNNQRAAIARTEQVLLNMVDAEKISEKEMRKAYRQGTQLKFTQPRDSDKYFTDFVVDLIPEFVGKTSEKLIVRTTFNPRYQKIAEDAVAKNMLEYGDAAKAEQAALVALAPGGAIRAMIGGVDYSVSQYNRVFQSQRQPGSAFKIFTYAAAFQNGMTPDTIVEDSPITVGKWSPKNFDGQFRGEISIRSAFTQSLNAATVYIAEATGRSNVLHTARKMGIKSTLAPTPSVVLGASEVNLLELAGSYGVLANNGFYAEPYAIETIKSPEGKVLYEHFRSGSQVLNSDTVYMMNDIMSGVIQYGTGRAANFGRSAGGKTGTSTDHRDAWFVGYTPDIIAGVWVGNDNNKAMSKVTGGSIPARIWRDFMAAASTDFEPKSLPTSGGWFDGFFGDGTNSGSQPSGEQGFWDSIIGGEAPRPAQAQPQPAPVDEMPRAPEGPYVDHEIIVPIQEQLAPLPTVQPTPAPVNNVPNNLPPLPVQSTPSEPQNKLIIE